MSPTGQSSDVPALENLHLCRDILVMAYILTNLTKVVLAPGEHLPFATDTGSMTFTEAEGCPLANYLWPPSYAEVQIRPGQLKPQLLEL